MEEKVILRCKKKTMLLIMIAIVFVLAGISFATMNPAEIETFKTLNSPDLIQGLGIFAAGFFGVVGLVLVWTLFDRTPALTIGREGITDNTRGSPASLIPWTEIVEFRENKIGTQKHVSIILKNPDGHKISGNVFHRTIQKINAGIFGTPVNISAAPLQIRHDELLTTMQKYFEHYLKGGYR